MRVTMVTMARTVMVAALVLAASTAEVKFPLRAGQVSLSPPCPPRNTVSNTQVGRRKVTVDRDGDRVKLACVNWWEQPH